MDLKIVCIFLSVVSLYVVPVIKASDDSTDQEVDKETKEQTAMDKVVDQVPVEELVDLICECRVEEACKADHPRDCYDLQQAGHTANGLYDIYPAYIDGPVKVYCDMETDGGGWTVFQRRADGLVDFFLDWASYKAGFGYPGSEFWLGNDNIFAISNQDPYELRIDLIDKDGNMAFAHYDEFRIGDESTKYKLAVSGYDGDAGNSFGSHSGASFSTKDQDHDTHSSNCAASHTGAWWYTSCHSSNLNGMYGDDTFAKGVNWSAWKGQTYSLKGAEMKMRPAQ